MKSADIFGQIFLDLRKVSIVRQELAAVLRKLSNFSVISQNYHVSTPEDI